MLFVRLCCSAVGLSLCRERLEVVTAYKVFGPGNQTQLPEKFGSPAKVEITEVANRLGQLAEIPEILVSDSIPLRMAVGQNPVPQ